jgi:hypothetical protein
MKKHIATKGKLAASFLMAGVLAVGTMGAALADGPAQHSGAKQGYFGNVTVKDENSFTVNTVAHGEIELAIDQDTHFRMPGESEVGFDDLELGSRVAILAQADDDTLTAVRVMLVPGTPQREHRVLTVIAASGNTVVAQDRLGNQVEVALEGGINGDLVGQVVTFVGERSQQSNRFSANAQVKIGQVIQRLEAHSQKLGEQIKSGRDSQERGRPEMDLAHVHDRLEGLMQQHLDRFEEIIDRAPEQARPNLETAMEMSLKGYRAALEALERPQDHVEARLGQRTVQGVVRKVDAGTGQITLQTHGGAELTLEVNSDTRINLEGQGLDLSDITPGALVSVRYDRQSAAASEILVRKDARALGQQEDHASGRVESRVIGTVTSINAGAGEVTITLEGGRNITLNLGPETEIKTEGAGDVVSPLVDRLVGQRTRVEYDSETRVVTKIETLPPSGTGDRDSLPIPGGSRGLPAIHPQDRGDHHRP